ncbi:unnamed protein product [Mytilus edulis]|uniref:B box-type domain-containing protein n=1 Tax=Mytilus edulis TaxID=6550 RepID=A0A8S3TFZ4_MYTED|nr:unnamed protein product [Mytilus edulis]
MMAQSVVETCEICNQALGIDFCEECEQTFCNHCKLMHLRMKISRNHTFKNVDHEEVKLNLCDQHNLGYILYCEKCNSLACKTCIIENHKGHELEDINIAKISELQVEVSEKLESYSKEIHEGSRNSLLLMKDQMKNHEKACKKAIEEINCRSVSRSRPASTSATTPGLPLQRQQCHTPSKALFPASFPIMERFQDQPSQSHSSVESLGL